MKATPGRRNATVDYLPGTGVAPAGWPAPYAEARAHPWIGQLLLGLPVSIGLLDAEGRMSLYNNALSVTAGPENCRTGNVADLVVDDDADRLVAAVQRAISDSSGRRVDISVALRSQPAQRQTVTITPVPRGLGVAAIFGMRDFRETLRAEAQVAAVTRMQSVGQLAGGVAHDFNNILTGIMAMTDLLLEVHPEDDPDHEGLAEIRRNCERGAALVGQLLAFARQQPQRQQLLDLKPLIDGLQPLLRQLIGSAVELSISGAMPDSQVSADPGQIEQIIVNLAVNARDAMNGVGQLRIEISEVPAADIAAEGHSIIPAIDHVVIRVGDTGSGIPAAIATKIFEPFFTTKPMGKGTGLGLSTVYGIVKQSNGFVFTRPKPQKTGTVFEIYLPSLPRQAEEPVVAPPPVKAPLIAVDGAIRVLLVEDDAAVRLAFQRGLTRHGFVVTAAAEAMAALMVLQSNQPIDVLVSDVMMPGIDGVVLCSKARLLRPGLPAILISGYADLPLHRAADAQGMRFVTKPVPIADLVAIITEASRSIA